MTLCVSHFGLQQNLIVSYAVFTPSKMQGIVRSVYISMYFLFCMATVSHNNIAMKQQMIHFSNPPTNLCPCNESFQALERSSQLQVYCYYYYCSSSPWWTG